MTRKDFIKFAQLIGDTKNEVLASMDINNNDANIIIKYLTNRMISILKQSNPNFDIGRFRGYINEYYHSEYTDIKEIVETFNNQYFDHNYKGTKFTDKDITIKNDELYLNMNNLKNNNFGYSGIAVYDYPLDDYKEPLRHIF